MYNAEFLSLFAPSRTLNRLKDYGLSLNKSDIADDDPVLVAAMINGGTDFTIGSPSLNHMALSAVFESKLSDAQISLTAHGIPVWIGHDGKRYALIATTTARIWGLWIIDGLRREAEIEHRLGATQLYKCLKRTKLSTIFSHYKELKLADGSIILL